MEEEDDDIIIVEERFADDRIDHTEHCGRDGCGCSQFRKVLDMWQCECGHIWKDHATKNNCMKRKLQWLSGQREDRERVIKRRLSDVPSSHHLSKNDNDADRRLSGNGKVRRAGPGRGNVWVETDGRTVRRKKDPKSQAVTMKKIQTKAKQKENEEEDEEVEENEEGSEKLALRSPTKVEGEKKEVRPVKETIGWYASRLPIETCPEQLKSLVLRIRMYHLSSFGIFALG